MKVNLSHSLKAGGSTGCRCLLGCGEGSHRRRTMQADVGGVQRPSATVWRRFYARDDGTISKTDSRL